MRGVLARAIEWRAQWIRDPAHRLQFLRRNLGERTQADRSATRQWVPLGKTVIVLAIGVALLCGAGFWGSWFWGSLRHMTTAAAKTTTVFKTPTVLLSNAPAGGAIGTVAAQPSTANDLPEPVGQVWLVQATPQFDLYSNGLRIEERYATSTAPRRYIAFAAEGNTRIGLGAELRSEPAGIVYHTTESHLAPFEEDQNQSLRRAGEGLLEYASRRRAYHFVIDRFGRVFRIVRESDYANHAGNSVWADERWIYINLNQSFLGVAFEASSAAGSAVGSAAVSAASNEAGASSGAGASPVNAAQIYAGRILTEMLRDRYDIPGSNCVAHAQVSVNPANHRIGYHLDWASGLPFARLGLPDNYKLELPSVEFFGFQGNPEVTGGGVSSVAHGAAQGMAQGMTQGMAQGLNAAAAHVRRAAAAQNLPLERYRAKLQKRYRDAIRALRGNGAYQE
jgi:hypothetical protein